MNTNYTENNEKFVLNWLKDNLTDEKLIHSLGTARCAAELAEKFGQNKEKAYTAGLLHDCAKCFKKDEMLKIAKTLKLEQGELENFKVLHAPVSAYVAKREFKVEDKEILSAIRWHTLGNICMSGFEKIIFLADKIEPETRDPKYRGEILKILDEKNGLDKAVLICHKETIKSLVKRNLKICQSTIDIYNHLISK